MSITANTIEVAATLYGPPKAMERTPTFHENMVIPKRNKRGPSLSQRQFKQRRRNKKGIYPVYTLSKTTSTMINI
jgi:hypothetical protein